MSNVRRWALDECMLSDGAAPCGGLQPVPPHMSPKWAGVGTCGVPEARGGCCRTSFTPVCSLSLVFLWPHVPVTPWRGVPSLTFSPGSAHMSMVLCWP